MNSAPPKVDVTRKNYQAPPQTRAKTKEPQKLSEKNQAVQSKKRTTLRNQIPESDSDIDSSYGLQLESDYEEEKRSTNLGKR